MFHRCTIALLSCFLLAASWQPAAAADQSLEEFIPKGVTPDPEQREVVLALAARVSRCNASYDQQGNLTGILLCNHNAFSRVKPETRPGADDATFARLSVVPSLRQMQLLKQPLSDDAFAILQQWPDLEIFCIEGHKGDNTGRFMRFINGHPKLKWLELKHLFGLDGTTVDELQAFPQLVRLELDNASATNRALPFLRRNPQIRDFELHRSNMSNEEIAELVDSLPNLERLALKPKGRCFDHRCLEDVSQLPELKVFGFHHWKEKMFVWEDGIEHLADMPLLTHVECPRKMWDNEPMKKLRAAKPNLENAGKQIIVEFDNDIQR